MNFERQPQEKNDEDLLRREARKLLRAEINPLGDKEFRSFLRRHFFTEGDAKKVIDEEDEKLQKEKAEKEKERHYLRKER